MLNALAQDPVLKVPQIMVCFTFKINIALHFT